MSVTSRLLSPQLPHSTPDAEMNTGSVDPEPGEPALSIPLSLGYIPLSSYPGPPGKPWKPILFLSAKKKKNFFFFDIPGLYLRIYRGLFLPAGRDSEELEG